MMALEQYKDFPPSRYMGSKNKIIKHLYNTFKEIDFESVVDLFSGSSSVSYLLKSMGKKVISNDYMSFASNISKSIIENSSVKLDEKDVKELLRVPRSYNKFVQIKFKNIFFKNSENKFIDIVRHNIKGIKNPFKKSLAMAALVKACQKKQARGIFTYIGNRYDDGRADLSKSFESQFIEAIDIFNNAVFSNKKINKSLNLDFKLVNTKADLIYIDPPYFSKHSDNEYIRRYHFLEGLTKEWKGLIIQESSKVKKFKKYPSMFDTEKGSIEAINFLINKFKKSTLIFSYSSNSLPTLKEFEKIVTSHGKKFDAKKINYRYSFGTQKKGSKIKNLVMEYIITVI